MIQAIPSALNKNSADSVKFAICRESGETGAASGVELAGKVEILLLSIPMLENVLNIVGELLNI